MRPLEGTMPGTPSPDPISTRRQRIATLARDSPQAALTTLAHHIDIDWMHEAYRRTRKDGAVGVDGQTAAGYAADLEGNLRSLLDRAKSGRYQAPPVRRVHIPKGTGSETRPIGIPTFEDKILQRAVTMVLESVYEQDFLDCSYGFRPGPLGAPGAGRALASADGGEGRVGPGDRHPKVFRCSGPPPPACDSSPEGT
jgi:RNA-directed DNA polymerase